MPDAAHAAEAAGYDGPTTAENKHDRFLAPAVAAVGTERMGLATAAAIAFPHSPVVVANASWGPRAVSRGRFLPGPGLRIRAHNERRFGFQAERSGNAWITETPPRTTRQVGAWIEKECGIAYQARPGLIALLHRLGMEHRKPKAASRQFDPARQAAFIKAHEDLLNDLAADEAVRFGDAVHPTHAVPPVGCRAPKDTKIALAQTNGRQRLNIHGAIDPETGQTRMLKAATVDAASTIMLEMATEAMDPGKRMFRPFVDNARYHHAKLVQARMAHPGRRINARKAREIGLGC